MKLLGLAIVKDLTEAMGSRVSVESGPGAGSTFTITLPDYGRPVHLRFRCSMRRCGPAARGRQHAHASRPARLTLP